MSFLERLARAAVKHAPEDLEQEEPDVERVDPHAEPPPEHARRRKDEPQEEDDEPVPPWILEPPTEEEMAARATWPDDVMPVIERVKGGPLALSAEDLPSPFQLKPWVTIRDVPRWLASIRRDVELGPTCAHARTGALQEDLRYLAKALEE